MGERDDYKFLEIRDAIASINQKVSLIGVVVEYGFPKKTKGTVLFVCSMIEFEFMLMLAMMTKKAGLTAATVPAWWTGLGSRMMNFAIKAGLTAAAVPAWWTGLGSRMMNFAIKAGLTAAAVPAWWTGLGSRMMNFAIKAGLTAAAVPTWWTGLDCFCTLKIVDQSYPKPGLSVNVFAEHFGALPHVALLGDIVQLSHVMMKIHGREVYAVFNKRSSAFALYDGKDGQSFLPYQAYPKFHPRDLDKKFIMSLRKWVVDFQNDEDPNDSHNFSLLRELKEGKSVNLACKVVNVQEFGKDEWIAFLWDGTDTRPNSLPIRLEDEKDNPLPLHLESLPLSRDKLETFPAMGSVLRVVFDQSIKKYGLQLLNVSIGEWMKFLNVHIEVHAGIWRGVLTPLTKVRYTPNKDRIVYERQSIFERRLQLRNGRIPYWSFPWMSRITEIDYKDVPFLTLMDALTYPEVTAKFRCAVRVVAAYPWEGKDFCCSHGIYRLRLTLEDPTARIHAYLYGEDGEKFFGGYPHETILTRKLNELLGVATPTCDDGKETKDDAARDPPWVQCCLKSYYLDKSDIWGTRHFRIFGTKVVLA